MVTRPLSGVFFGSFDPAFPKDFEGRDLLMGDYYAMVDSERPENDPHLCFVDYRG